jgi:hypothetical protein
VDSVGRWNYRPRPTGLIGRSHPALECGRQGSNSGPLIICFDVAAVDGEQRLLLLSGQSAVGP